MLNSLTVGASALRAEQSKFDSISNNISNVNTTGFKSTNINFIDQFSQMLNLGKAPDTTGGKGIGGINPMQIGLGVKAGSITTNMSQGTLQTTNRSLDLALQGDGYFVYKNNSNFNSQNLFSRAGVLTQDKQGFLVDSNSGAYLQGYGVTKNSAGVNIVNNNAPLSNLQVDPNTKSAPQQTKNVVVGGNLDPAMAATDTKQTSITVYDTNGASHTALLTFTKTATANQFSLDVTLDNTAVGAQTTVTFNADGTIQTPTSLTLLTADLNTSLGSTTAFAKDITMNFTDPNSVTSGLTQFAGNSTVTASSQDGYQSGSLNDMTIDKSGQIWGNFTNGQSEVLGQVAVAKFTNPSALAKVGQNFLTESPNSDKAVISTAAEGFPSTSIVSGALEQSNVDLTNEFTEMISTQRAFEAASRIITVSDQLLTDITSLKR